MKYPIRIIKKCRVKIDGQVRSFERDQEIEIEEEEGRTLIREGYAVPGLQYTKPISIMGR